MGTLITIELVQHTCGACGVVFGIERTRYDQLLQSHENFYCPNGHARHFVAQTDSEKRIAQLERSEKALKTSKDFWEQQARSGRETSAHQQRRINGYKGVLTRTKRKIVAGRCLCCSHQFKDLERHMVNRHPNFDLDKAVDALAEKI
ncbi:MAG TPA: hypothetical protein VGM82_24825 [Gemmatimonadaceae bacterium]|jgi:hypothetical protein